MKVEQSQGVLMRGVSVLHLRFLVRATTPIEFSEQPGSALRGVLYAVLSENFCSEPFERVTPDHQARCPVCWLLAAEDDLNRTGRNLPRPLIIEPPLEHRFVPGQTFSFGIALVSRAQDFLPFVARAVQKMGSRGTGKGRGTFELIGIQEYSPIQDSMRDLMHQNLIKSPTLHVTPARIDELSPRLPDENMVIDLLSPLRLMANNRLLRDPDPEAFIRRLLERCQTLATYYGDTEVSPADSATWRAAADHLAAQARALKLTLNDTRWQEVWSGSQRLQRSTPISGIMGRFRWDGEVRDLKPWLMWGQSLHVGKDAVKGNGWYQIVRTLQ